MKTIAPGIQQWSWFSDEKQLDFNGLLLTINDHCILVDPPPLQPEDRTAILKSPRIDYVLITNRDHAREAETCRREFNAKVYAPAADAPLGVREFRLASTLGVSSIGQLVVVDDPVAE